MIKEEIQPPKLRFGAQWCRLKIFKFNRESNRRLRLNWQCNRLRLHFVFGQFNRLRLTMTITPCLVSGRHRFDLCGLSGAHNDCKSKKRCGLRWWSWTSSDQTSRLIVVSPLVSPMWQRLPFC